MIIKQIQFQLTGDTIGLKPPNFEYKTLLLKICIEIKYNGHSSYKIHRKSNIGNI